MPSADQVPVRIRLLIDAPVAGRHATACSRRTAIRSTPKSRNPVSRWLSTWRSASRRARGFSPTRFGAKARCGASSSIRVGQSAGDRRSPWSRRMKIDIHDIGQDLLDRAVGRRSTHPANCQRHRERRLAPSLRDGQTDRSAAATKGQHPQTDRRARRRAAASWSPAASVGWPPASAAAAPRSSRRCRPSPPRGRGR